MSADCRRRGISLLEAVIGLAIVAMTALGALSAAAVEYHAVERSRRAIEAAALAAQRLYLLDLLFDNQLLSLPDSVARGRFEPPLNDYHWTTTVTHREKPPGVYDVLLRIEWTEGAYVVRSALYRRPLSVVTP